MQRHRPATEQKAGQHMRNHLELPVLQLYPCSCQMHAHPVSCHSEHRLCAWCITETGSADRQSCLKTCHLLYAVGQGDSFVSTVPRPLPSLAALGVVQIACGESHNAALTIHGQVFTWGRGKYGALGLGAFDSSSWPQHVTALQEPACQVRHCLSNLMYPASAKPLSSV